jgi:hypothetical protein
VKTPILGGAYVARSVNAAANRMVNLYPEVVPEGGKEPAFLQRCPGLQQLTGVSQIASSAGPIRGLHTFNNTLYIVSGNTLYKVKNDWIYDPIGTIDGLNPVSMADNGVQLFVAATTFSYIYNSITDVFAQITDPDFPGAVSVGYLDGYFVFNEPASQRVWVTSLLDGTSVDPLDFASAEGNPDNIVALLVDHREVWLFGTTSIEVWYNAGLADFPLARIEGAFMETGCLAPYSVAKLDNTVFWLGSDARGNGIVYRNQGYNAQRVSTHAVEWQLQQYSNLSDAIAYTYQQDGHAFYVLSFPGANQTWCFDVSTGLWHERAGWDGVNFTRHRSQCQVNFDNKIIVGDWQGPKLYVMDTDVYDDDGDVQRWLRSWRALPTGQNTLKRTAHHALQLDCESGVGLNSGQGSDPRVMLRWSDDGGHTWSNEHWANMGKLGEYGKRVIWRRLGMTTKLRDRVYEISGSDPVKIAIMGAELSATPTSA